MKAEIATVSLACMILIAISLVLVGQSSAAIDLNTLVGLWLMDEGEGGVTKDSSGNDNDRELVKEAAWVDGKFGKGIESDGVDDGVNCGDIDALDFGIGDFTLCVWIKAAPSGAGEAGNGWSRILDKFWTTGFSLMRSAGGAKVQFEVGGNAQSTISVNNAFDDSWHHVAAVRFDNTKSRIYIDGKLDVEGNLVGGDQSNDFPFTMAYDDQNLGGNMKCSLDEVAVFNVALADEDIEKIATEGLSEIIAVSPADRLAIAWGAIKARQQIY